MSRAAAHSSSPDTVVAALLYLIDTYRRRPCPCLASCIAQHCEYLATHPQAAAVVKQMVAAMKCKWQGIALAAPRRIPPASLSSLAFH